MRVLILSFLIVLIDQGTKLFVKGISIPSLGIQINGTTYGYSKPLLGNLLRLTYIENPGMAFGIDIGGKLFFSIFSIIASVAIIIYLYRSRRDAIGFRIALAVILGGAVGNLIDRVFYGVIFGDAPLFYGKVVDFLDVDFFDISLWGHHFSRWPVFNVADAAVTLGVILLLVFHRSALAGNKTDITTASGSAPDLTSIGSPSMTGELPPQGQNK